MYEFAGEIVKVTPTRAFGTKGRVKRELWVKELPEGKYSNTVPFTLKGERCKSADNIALGDEVKIGFVMEGRIWDKHDGTEPRCFGNAVCLKLEVTQKSAPRDLPLSGGASAAMEADDQGDMPF